MAHEKAFLNQDDLKCKIFVIFYPLIISFHINIFNIDLDFQQVTQCWDIVHQRFAEKVVFLYQFDFTWSNESQLYKFDCWRTD